MLKLKLHTYAPAFDIYQLQKSAMVWLLIYFNHYAKRDVYPINLFSFTR